MTLDKILFTEKAQPKPDGDAEEMDDAET